MSGYITLLLTPTLCPGDSSTACWWGKSCPVLFLVSGLNWTRTPAQVTASTQMMYCSRASPQHRQSEDGTSLDKQIQEQVQFNYRTEGALIFLGDKPLVPRINMLRIAVQWSDKYVEASEESSHRLCQKSDSKTKMKSENPNTFFIPLKLPPNSNYNLYFSTSEKVYRDTVRLDLAYNVSYIKISCYWRKQFCYLS